MDAVIDQEAVELWSAVEPHRREYTTPRIDANADDCGLYHDDAPALH
jgi:hypothetical protein